MMVAGRDPGSKMNDARKIDLRILNEKQFEHLVAEMEGYSSQPTTEHLLHRDLTSERRSVTFAVAWLMFSLRVASLSIVIVVNTRWWPASSLS
jgi:hypothetical protein